MMMPLSRYWDKLLNPVVKLYMVILGDPGSGKSTLTQYITLNWAEKPTPIIPLLIELRKYAIDRTLPKDFLEFFHQGSGAICRLNQQRLHEKLKAGEAFVMFDGLDEIFDISTRNTIVTEIIRFTNEYPNVKVVVTSRILLHEWDIERGLPVNEKLEPDTIGRHRKTSHAPQSCLSNASIR